MIKFFRRIRQNLLAENRFRKYLVYAFGEIFLVVIGILIALAINNWNQNRINRETERSYLAGLREEFEVSRLKLQELISVNRKSYNGARKILKITANEKLPSEKEFSLLLYHSFSSDVAFNPNNSLLREMINSGNLQKISSTRLRIELTNWFATLEDITRQERELAIQREKILDMFRSNNSSLSTILEHAGIIDEMNLPKQEGQVGNLDLLSSKEFENNILMFIITSHATENAHYMPLMRDLEGILVLVNQELH
ncbi:DUF6090 family protein [Salinimicrobium sp. GXAS 041]|uniref:DUF6090 family protein n=1 Tax=Salinimicrobium sp. GXAS 041 TaxID=3400806 RepID=UPI003C70A279